MLGHQPNFECLQSDHDYFQVRVACLASSVINKPFNFTIDASEAGAGNMEIVVTANGDNVTYCVQAEGHANFCGEFRPSSPECHLISVMFNNESVIG
jgi:filamin